MPQVSVIMPVFNASETVTAAVLSILNQTFGDFELILVDDGSTDDTRSVVDEIDDRRLQVLHLEQNQGVAAALNVGIEQAAGELIARMDADDVSQPERLRLQVSQFEADPELTVAGTFVTTKGPGSIMWTPPIGDESIRARLLFGTGFMHPTVMMRRSKIDASSLRYEPSFVPAEDYELWTRLAGTQDSKFANLPLPLLTYQARPRDTNYGMRQRVMTAQISVGLGTDLGLVRNPEEHAMWKMLHGLSQDGRQSVRLSDLLDYCRNLGDRAAPQLRVGTAAMQAELRHRWYTMGINESFGFGLPISGLIRSGREALVRSYLAGRSASVARRSRLLRLGFSRWQKMKH